MSLNNLEHSGFSDASIASPIRRPAREVASDMSSNDSLVPQNSFRQPTIRQVRDISAATMKTAKSRIIEDDLNLSSESLVSNPFSEHENTVQGGRLSFPVIYNSDADSLNSEHSGHTIFSDAHDHQEIKRLNDDAHNNNSPIIPNSIKWPNVLNSGQGLEHPRPILNHGSISSASNLFADSDYDERSPVLAAQTRERFTDFENRPFVKEINISRTSLNDPLESMDGNRSPQFNAPRNLFIDYGRPDSLTTSSSGSSTSSLLNDRMLMDNGSSSDDLSDSGTRPISRIQHETGYATLPTENSPPILPTPAPAPPSPRRKSPKHYPRYSQLRRSGTAFAARSGLPRLPNFPSVRKPKPKPSAIRKPATSDMGTNVILDAASNTKPEIKGINLKEKYDKFGRPESSRKKTWICLLAGIIFPPLWLFMSAGYFDTTLGTIPRWAKFTSLMLAGLTLAAGTTLVVVFSLLNISYDYYYIYY